MTRYLLLMHGDTTSPEDGAAWKTYLGTLSASGRLAGGSSLAPPTAIRRGAAPSDTTGVVGYLLVEATDADAAASLLVDNPTYQAGGTVHIHQLVED